MFSLMNVSKITQTFGLFSTGGYGPFLSFCSWINRTCWLKKSWQGNQKSKITFPNMRITLYPRMVRFLTTQGLNPLASLCLSLSLSIAHTQIQSHALFLSTSCWSGEEHVGQRCPSVGRVWRGSGCYGGAGGLGGTDCRAPAFSCFGATQQSQGSKAAGAGLSSARCFCLCLPQSWTSLGIC